MRPKLSKQGQAAMTKLTNIGPQASDHFERMVAGKITGLSMQLEQLNAQAASLREDLAATEQTLTETVGEYQGWVEALAGYHQSQQMGQRPPVAADGGQVPSPPQPSLAATEDGDQPAATEDGDQPAATEDGDQDKPQGDDPKGKPQDSPQEAGDADGPDGHGDPAPASDGHPGQPDA